MKNTVADDLDFDGFDNFRTDENLEVGEGVRIEYESGRAFVIRRAGGRNVAYHQALNQRMAILGKRKPTPQEDRAIIVEVYAETIIVGWYGITAGGKEVPFTKANCIKFMTKFPELFSDLAMHANRLDNFLVAAKEEALGN